MVELTAGIDERQLAEVNRKCGLFIDQSKIDRAINRATKRAADSAKAESKRQITTQYTAQSGYVGKKIKTTRNTGLGVTGSAMRITDSSIALPKFIGTKPDKPSKKPKPQNINVKKSTGVFTMTDWFAAEMKSSHIGIFRRGTTKKGAARMKKPYQRSGHPKWGRDTQKKGREPLEEKYGPATAGMFKNPEVMEPVVKYAGETLAKRIDHEIEELLNQ